MLAFFELKPETIAVLLSSFHTFPSFDLIKRLFLLNIDETNASYSVSNLRYDCVIDTEGEIVGTDIRHGKTGKQKNAYEHNRNLHLTPQQYVHC